MKLVYAKITNLAGLYAGTGLRSIELDFSKAKHNIVYIVGANGSGKSTLMSVLHPLPDSPSMYIDHVEGYKKLIYIDEYMTYIIDIYYPVSGSGARLATRAYFTETNMNTNQTLEMNSNGTINAYKDLIYSRFNLDPNFMALSYLSVEDRGIVDKKPSERKRFVANILESVEVYNDIYKTLNKRSSVYKSLRNTIVAKIDSIGNLEGLKLELKQLNTRIIALQNKEKQSIASLSSAKAAITLLDPNNENRTLYESLMKEYNEKAKRYELLSSSYKEDPDTRLSYLAKELKSISDSIASLEKDISKADTKIEMYDEQLTKVMSSIREVQYEITAIEDFGNLDSIHTLYMEYLNRVNSTEEVFRKNKIDYKNISLSEYKTGINLISTIESNVTAIKGQASYEAIKRAVSYLDRNETDYDVARDISVYEDEMEKLKLELASTLSTLEKVKYLSNRVSILSNRPEGCTIDSCPYIKDAIEAQRELDTISIEDLEDNVASNKKRQSEITDTLDIMREVKYIYDQAKVIRALLLANQDILNKFPDIRITDTSVSIVLVKLIAGDHLMDSKKLSEYLSMVNLIETYHTDKIALENATSKYNECKDQVAKMNSLINQKASLTEEQISIKRQKDETIKARDSIYSTIKEKQLLIDSKEKEYSGYESKKALSIDIAELKSKLSVLAVNIDKISKLVDETNRVEGELISIQRELEPSLDRRESLVFSINTLNEYSKELEEYNDKYTLIELLKDYASPTTGIQTIFMQLYMNKTLELANTILRRMFNNDLELMPYVITDTEFRIPVRQLLSHIVVPDVSGCSTSQKSMIAMILGSVLAYHGSSKYNILRLDEIDGGLDQYNRAAFPSMLRFIMQTLDIEQCFIVSHSSEADLSDVDMISLNPVSNNTLQGNIIFSL